MADLKTRDLKGVELLAVGTWNGTGCPEGGCEFTQKHIDQAVKAGKELDGTFEAPVKLGHDDDQKLLQTDGYPAAGWVKNLRRVGEKLIGDLVKVPEKVAQLIDAGAYRKRSVELKQDVEIDGTTYPLVLTGLALLGADLPAVEGLKDITKLYQSLALELDDDAHVVMFEEDDGEPADVETLVAELDDWLRRAKPRFRGKPGSPTLTQLHRALREGLKRTVKASKEPNPKEGIDVDEQAIRKLLSIDDDADIGEAITGLQKEVVALKESEPDKAETVVLKRELGEARERILTSENEHSSALLMESERHRLKEAEWSVDTAIQAGRIAPRNKGMALDMAKRGPEAFETFVTQLHGVDLSERGTSADTEYPDYEPTPEEVKQAKSFGRGGPEWRRQFIMAKAKESGVELDLPVLEDK